MTYLRVQWMHAIPTEPVLLYSELDAERWEVRKVEIWADGTKGFASSSESTVGTRLGEVPVPPPDEIAADPQFAPVEITREEFEAVWEARQSTN